MRDASIAAAALLFVACGARTDVDRATEPPRPTERCDGVDEDGDGRIDEGLPLLLAGESVRVRTEEGSSGDCVRCRWALSDLAPTRAGMVLVTRLYDEGEPDPNLLRRRLDASGRPLEPWDLTLSELSTTDWFPSVHWVRGVDGAALGTSTQTGGGPPRPMITVLDADGTRVGPPTPIMLAPDRGVGRWGTPQITRLADGTFLAAVDCNSDVCLAAIGRDGTPRNSWALSERSDLLPREGVFGVSAPVLVEHAGLVGVATLQVHVGPPPRPELLFFLLAEDGTLLREQRLDLPLPDFEYVPIDTLRIVGDDDGFLVMFLRRDNCGVDERRGRWVARFDRDGALTAGPTNIEPEWCYFGADLKLRPRTRGGLWLSGTRKLDPALGPEGEESFLAELDDQGTLRWASSIDVPLHSILELDDGRMVAAVSTVWRHDEANPIDIVPLGCAP